MEEETSLLTPDLYRACEAVGQVMELWGFKRIHGMIWTYIFLQPHPVSAREIREGLGISSGLVSMTLQELQHWDVVHRHSPPGERKDYYRAEFNVGKPILKVLREREYYQIGVMLDTLKGVRAELASDSHAREQLDALIRVGELGLSLFGHFLDLSSLVLRGSAQRNLAAESGQVLKALARFLGKAEGQPS